ncbi:MAG: hypothetical protein WAN11_13755 [Syntrophobacteraceae bacterium]
MNGLPVFQENDPKKFILLWNPCPPTYSAIGLDFGLFWELDDVGYPLVQYHRPVGPFSHVCEIPSGFQIRSPVHGIIGRTQEILPGNHSINATI